MTTEVKLFTGTKGKPGVGRTIKEKVEMRYAQNKLYACMNIKNELN